MTADAQELPRDPKLERLAAHVRALGSVLVCYSGGIDSALVLAVAHRVLGAKAIGMTAVGPALAPTERDEAVRFARWLGARHELVESHEIEDPRYVANASDRCFHCKSELYRVAEQKRVEWGAAHVVNGTNTDDLGDYRPGLEAARDAAVESPFVTLGIDKREVRRLAELLDLPIWDKPAAACLASRIPYGTRVTRERLSQIAALEARVKHLGIRQARVRWHGLGSELADVAPTTMARIEIARDELERAFQERDRIVEAGKELGFTYVTLDLEGYRTGSHNEVLKRRELRVL